MPLEVTVPNRMPIEATSRMVFMGAAFMYADSGNYSEYDCIERVAKDYQDRCKEPTVTITWSECNDFEDGEVIPLAEANKRFEFTR